MRAKRNGARLPDPMTRFTKDDGTGCWVWTTTRSKAGYGKHGDVYAHRLIYEKLVGPIPSGLEIDHLCRNRACVNPAHLEPVTHGENVSRGMASIVQRTRPHRKATHCKRGHELTPDNLITRKKGRTCRACMRLHRKKHYAKYSESIKASVRKWREENPERRRTWGREWARKKRAASRG